MARRGKRRFSKNALIAAAVLAFLIGVGATVATERLVGRTTFGGMVWTAEDAQESSVNVVAVRSDGLGVVASLRVRVTPGEGRILVDTHPFVGFDFQAADRTAVKVAAEITGFALDDDGIGLKGADVLYTVSTQGSGEVEIQSIDGPSAGAATTVATIAAFENKRIKSNVVITGTIQEDHTLGTIGGVYAKAKAAYDNGMTLFLVPKGQLVEVYRQAGPFAVTEYVSISYLQQYFQQQGWALQIEEVSTIEEAANLMLE